MARKLITGLLALVALALSACGGGGGGSGGGGAINHAPIANAGAAQVVTTGALVTFSGATSSDPDGNAITYAWTLTSKPAGSTATLTGATTVSPTLRADLSGVYGVSLVVSDASLSSAAATTTATAMANSGDVTAATGAGLIATIDVSTTSFKIQWLDTFPAGASYRVELQQGDGSFSAVETLGGAGGAGAQFEWSRPFAGPQVYRVVALVSGREIPLLTPTSLGTLSLSAPDNPLITFNQSEPLTGTVRLTFSPLPTGATVSWRADNAVIGSGNPFDWNTTNVANGPHVMLAKLDLANSVFVDVKRTAQTFNPFVAVTASTTESGDNLIVWASASASVGVQQVRVIMDGGVPQTLAAPNACLNPCGGGPFTHYRFTYSKSTLGNGTHTATVRATDTGGNFDEITLSIPVQNAPVLTVTSPRSGAFLTDTLTLQGTATVPAGPAPEVTAQLAGGTFYGPVNTTSFIASTPLTFLPFGPVTLIVNASAGTQVSTVTRTVNHVSSPAFAPPPLFTVAETAQLLGAEGDLVLVAENGSIRLHNVGTNADFTLSPLSDGTAVTPTFVYGRATGSDPGCKPSLDTCIYRWSTTTGAGIDLSALDTTVSQAVGNQRSAPVAKGRYAAWRNQLADSSPITYTIYDSVAGTFTSVPTVTTFTASENFDIGDVGGVPTLFYIATNGNGAEVVKWSAPGGTVVMATSSLPIQSVNTDGVNVAYTRFSGAVPVLNVTSAAGNGATTTVIGDDTQAATVDMRDGVLSWRDFSGGRVFQTKVWSQATGQVNLGNFLPYTTGMTTASGYAAYIAADGTYVWNSATNTSAKRLDIQASPLFVTGAWFYLKSGDAIYRVSLN